MRLLGVSGGAAADAAAAGEVCLWYCMWVVLMWKRLMSAIATFAAVRCSSEAGCCLDQKALGPSCITKVLELKYP